MKVIDYELINDISYLFEKKIIIYGAGMYGKRVAITLFQMNIEVDKFCETNRTKNLFLGKEIISANNLIQNYDEKDVLVIIASEKNYNEMFEELQSVQNLNLCTYYAFFVSLHLNLENELILESMREKIRFFREVSLHMAIDTFLDSWRTTRVYCDMLLQSSLVWLYQPGKVGSMTIHSSNTLKTYHVHSLAYAFNADKSMRDICTQMLGEIKKKPIKIITGVREPISRDISVFFQGTEEGIGPLIRYDNSWLYLFGDYSNHHVRKLDAHLLKNKICPLEKSINQSFENMCREIMMNKSDEFSWFDYEIKALFGVDIYKYPFDKEKGYSIIEQDDIRILVYKCEKLNKLEDVIGKFLGEPSFLLRNSNQGDEKIYSYIYKKFKNDVKLNKMYFDYYYDNNLKLRHFYTEIEIFGFMDKWKKFVNILT